MTENKNYNYKPLPEPIPITKQLWPEGTLPLVHTRTMTYMHESYIKECIEGILMQKTTFPVHVLIHDDASTDRTAEIVKEYELKYPHLIKAYYQKENSHTEKDKSERRVEFTRMQIGKYEALCEGDDYWTDPLKLQKQTMFMEGNSGYSLCYHKHKHLKNGMLSESIPSKGKDFSGMELIGTPGGIAMCTKFFINVYNNPKIPQNEIMTGDYAFNAYLGTHGNAKFLADIKPSVRRWHSGGVWTTRSDLKKLTASLNGKIKVYNYFKKSKNEELIKVSIMAIYNKISESIHLIETNKVQRHSGILRFKIFGVIVEINHKNGLQTLKKIKAKLKF